MTNNSTQRLEAYDIIRGGVIFLVVLGHLITTEHTENSADMRALFLFIYSFHMPLFLFLDGLFSKKTIDEKRYDKIFSYLILYFFYRFFIALITGVLNRKISMSLFTVDTIPWYALALFWFCLVTLFTRRFSERWVLAASVVLACFAGYDPKINDFLVLSRTIVYYPFFFAGYCADPRLLLEKLRQKRAIICGFAFFLAAAVLCCTQIDKLYLLRPLFTGRNPYSRVLSKHGLVLYGGLLRLFCYAVSTALGLSFMTVMLTCFGKVRALAKVGKGTLGIYVLHRPLRDIIYSAHGLNFISFCSKNNIGNWVILPLAAAITLLFALPFWQKLIRAIISPKLSSKAA